MPMSGETDGITIAYTEHAPCSKMHCNYMHTFPVCNQKLEA